MKAAVLTAPRELVVQDIPKPILKKGQVLIKMAYAPVNPADLAFLTGTYGLKKEYPVVPGLEGSGVVVESGGGLLANYLKGKNVACSAPFNGNGTWAPYMVTPATQCVKLSKGVSLEQGSMFFVNPFSAISFLKMVKKGNFDAVIMTAAKSSLATLTFDMLKHNGTPYLGVVRGLAPDANHLISSDSPEFTSNIKEFTKKYKKVLFLDAIGGGTVPYTILGCIKAEAKMVIYGRLSQEPAEISPEQFIFNKYEIGGFWLNKEAQTKSFIEAFKEAQQVNKWLKNGYETKIAQKIKVDNINEGLAAYQKNMSAGKVLLDFTN